MKKKEREGAQWLDCVWVFCEKFFGFVFGGGFLLLLVFVVGGGLGMWCGIWTRKFCLWWVI